MGYREMSTLHFLLKNLFGWLIRAGGLILLRNIVSFLKVGGHNLHATEDNIPHSKSHNQSVHALQSHDTLFKESISNFVYETIYFELLSIVFDKYIFCFQGEVRLLCWDAGGMRQSTHVASRPSACTPPKEVRYPFGVQNDLGQVILGSKAKVSLDDRLCCSLA